MHELNKIPIMEQHKHSFQITFVFINILKVVVELPCQSDYKCVNCYEKQMLEEENMNNVL